MANNMAKAIKSRLEFLNQHKDDELIKQNKVQIELIAGKNIKQCTRMTMSIDNKLVANISTSAFYGSQFIDSLEEFYLNYTNPNTKLNNANSVATLKVNHAHTRGNIDMQKRTYCKDELYSLEPFYSNEAEHDELAMFNVLDTDILTPYNWLMFVNNVTNKHGVNSQDIQEFSKKACKDVSMNFVKIGNDLYLDIHTYNKVLKVKENYAKKINNKYSKNEFNAYKIQVINRVEQACMN